MSLIEMSLKTMAEIKGGIVERMMLAALNRVALDLRAAADIAEWRKVTLEIRAKPIMEDGELADVIVEFAVGQKIPSRVTSSRMVVRSTTNGSKQLFFQQDAPDNPAQGSLFEDKSGGTATG